MIALTPSPYLGAEEEVKAQRKWICVKDPELNSAT
jgi:hypothetical protein